MLGHPDHGSPPDWMVGGYSGRIACAVPIWYFQAEFLVQKLALFISHCFVIIKTTKKANTARRGGVRRLRRVRRTEGYAGMRSSCSVGLRSSSRGLRPSRYNSWR
jgi:hypothetical protein